MLIMKYFTCEGRFSRFYRYHSRLLMHFRSTKPLDLPHYLYKILIKMTEEVQSRKQDHYPSIFHHGLVRLIVFHHLSSINRTLETFMERVATIPTTSPHVNIAPYHHHCQHNQWRLDLLAWKLKFQSLLGFLSSLIPMRRERDRYLHPNISKVYLHLTLLLNKVK